MIEQSDPRPSTRVLKLAEHDEEKEIAFELDYLASLTVEERIRLLELKRQEIRTLLEMHGHGRAPEVIKRA